MKITTVAVTYGRKFNLGDYESMHIELTAWADIDEDERPDEATAALFADVKQAVRLQAVPVLKAAHRPRIINKFTGVPVATPASPLADVYDGANGEEDDA